MTNPFKGLRSFRKGELLYGRDDELVALYRTLDRNNTLLFYGESGCGKSSVLHAGLPMLFKKYEWSPLYFRLNDNRGEFFCDDSPLSDDQLIEGAYLINSQVYLIFDQVEEIFYDQNETVAAAGFFKRLKELRGKYPEIKLIFCFREEYLSRFDKYDSIEYIPRLFDHRFRLMAFEEENLIIFLERSLNEGKIRLEGGEARANIESILIPKLIDDNGGIHLPHIQLWLQSMYLLDMSEEVDTDPGTWNIKELDTHGNVSNTILVHLKDCLKKAIAEFQCSELYILRLLTKFIDNESLHRETVDYRKLESNEQKVVSFLSDDDKCLFNLKNDGINDTYELAHEAYVRPIKKNKLLSIKDAGDNLKFLNKLTILRVNPYLESKGDILSRIRGLYYLKKYEIRRLKKMDEDILSSDLSDLMVKSTNRYNLVNVVKFLVTVSLIFFTYTVFHNNRINENVSDLKMKHRSQEIPYVKYLSLATEIQHKDNSLYAAMAKKGRELLDTIFVDHSNAKKEIDKLNKRKWKNGLNNTSKGDSLLCWAESSRYPDAAYIASQMFSIMDTVLVSDKGKVISILDSGIKDSAFYFKLLFIDASIKDYYFANKFSCNIDQMDTSIIINEFTDIYEKGQKIPMEVSFLKDEIWSRERNKLDSIFIIKSGSSGNTQSMSSDKIVKSSKRISERTVDIALLNDKYFIGLNKNNTVFLGSSKVDSSKGTMGRQYNLNQEHKVTDISTLCEELFSISYANGLVKVFSLKGKDVIYEFEVLTEMNDVYATAINSCFFTVIGRKKNEIKLMAYDVSNLIYEKDVKNNEAGKFVVKSKTNKSDKSVVVLDYGSSAMDIDKYVDNSKKLNDVKNRHKKNAQPTENGVSWTCIYYDSATNKSIFCNTQGGCIIWDYASNSIYGSVYFGDDKKRKKNIWITKAIIKNDQKVVLGMYSGEVLLFNFPVRCGKEINTYKILKDDLFKENITVMELDSEGRLLVGDAIGGFWCFDLGTDMPDNRADSKYFDLSSKVTAVCSRAESKWVLVSTKGGDIYKCNFEVDGTPKSQQLLLAEKFSIDDFYIEDRDESYSYLIYNQNDKIRKIPIDVSDMTIRYDGLFHYYPQLHDRLKSKLKEADLADTSFTYKKWKAN